MILIVCTLAACWLGMQIVHEFGHVLGAGVTGGEVRRVVLRPWTISRTDLGHNPEPLLVSWAGPAFGAAAPVAAWLMGLLVRAPGVYLLRFFAGFCLIANGAYLGGGALDRVGDAGDLQRHGAALWPLLLFAALTVPAGLWLWHGQGRHFGFGGSRGRVNRQVVWASAVLLAVVVVLQFLVGES
jgi:hypothetical protein